MNQQTAIARAQSALRLPEVEDYANRLRADGYVIIRDVIDPAIVINLDRDLSERFQNTPFSEGVFYGSRTKRFGRLLAHSNEARRFVQNELILAVVEEVLSPWCDVVQLNLTQALELHPGSPAQVPHRDQDMWAGPKGQLEYLVNVMWPFAPYTRENGATIVWPGSNHMQDQAILPVHEAVAAEMEPGSALMFLGSTLHGGGANQTAAIRRGMIISYCLGWLKPYENQWLAYPPEVARTFPSELAGLVGYRQHRPNLGNYDGQCPSVLLREVVAPYLNAVDELRPDQVQVINEYLDGRLQAAA